MCGTVGEASRPCAVRRRRRRRRRRRTGGRQRDTKGNNPDFPRMCARGSLKQLLKEDVNCRRRREEWGCTL